MFYIVYMLTDENGAKRKKMWYGWGQKFGALLSQHNIVIVIEDVHTNWLIPYIIHILYI